jgi:hypothetical protein
MLLDWAPYAVVVEVYGQGFTVVKRDVLLGGNKKLNDINLGLIVVHREDLYPVVPAATRLLAQRSHHETENTHAVSLRDDANKPPLYQGNVVVNVKNAITGDIINSIAPSTALFSGFVNYGTGALNPAGSAFASNGTSTFNNVNLGPYTVAASAPGFFNNKDNLNVLTSPYLYNINLVPKFATDVDRQLIVTLEYKSANLDLDLCGPFNVGNKLSCVVGPGFRSCGNAQYGQDVKLGGYQGAESITVNGLGDTAYLFYVRKFDPTTFPKGLEPNYPSAITGVVDYANENRDITKTHARVKVYIPGNYAGPVHTFDVPALNSLIIGSDGLRNPKLPTSNDKLTWVAFCYYGGVGPTSIAPANKFHENTDASVHPNVADYCTNP